MKNKIYVLTEDLNFFYKINKELNLLKIKFKVLNLWNKLPKVSSIIITTSEEIEKIKNIEENLNKILAYSKEEDFDIYFLRVLAAHRVGFKINYTELTISIDPGTKYFGFIAFLDEYYLFSQTFYDKKDLVRYIKDFINKLQKNNADIISVKIKIGQGILNSTIDLITEIYSIFKKRDYFKIFLIDEKKSSKIKILVDGKKFPKHEASALIIALREGTEVDPSNFQKIIRQHRNKKNLKISIVKKKNNLPIEKGISFKDVANKILDGLMSLSESTERINDCIEFI